MRRRYYAVYVCAVVTVLGGMLVAGSWSGNALGGRNPTPATKRAALASCVDATPFQAYRFIAGIDSCPQPLSAAALAALQDPFAVNVLQKGLGNQALWPSAVEQIVSLVAAVPGFGANQKNYLIGEGSQITAATVARDQPRNLRYVLTWGANASPSVFVSAAPTGTHPGKPASFLQVIGYDQTNNLFNYYQYVSVNDVANASPGGTTKTWAWAGNSPNAGNAQSAGQGCFQCHINGALNMKELVTPWNNWNSPRASIAAGNIPAAVAQDPLFAALSGADVLQTNFQSLQSRYTQGLVAASIKSGAIGNVPALLRRLIQTTTINFQSSFSTPLDTTDIQVPSDFFIFNSALTMPQINLAFTMPPAMKIPRTMHDAFVSQHRFALQQVGGASATPIYQQPGTTFSAFFVPLPAFEDVVAIRELINQHVIDANFAASVLLVDFANPVFSAQRTALMQYAARIQTAQVLTNGTSNPHGVPAQFIALVTAAAMGQPACDPATSALCSPEQQFLYFAGQSDWKTRARNLIDPYLAAVVKTIQTSAGAADYLTLSVSRQSQFAGDPGPGNLDEFSLLLPCNDIVLKMCKRMNTDGTTGDDTKWQSACQADMCLPTH